jgi:probable F420-dependent oxidoreductase
MKFMIDYPLLSDRDGGAWVRPESMAQLARDAEAAGVDAIALTDHPAPSKKWLEGGGHETLDPFVGLAYMAAATQRLRLMTYLTVVPYRNPLLLAKSMTSLDVVSGGRATFVLGTGYLRSEFAALGVEFDERNELFDESAEVLRGIWSTDSFSFEGRHFTARGQIIKPVPVQQPHPPLWIGGNATVVRERVARWAQGWAPLQGGPVLFRTTRTAPITSESELAEMIRDLWNRIDAAGRSRDEVDIIATGGAERPGRDAGADEHIDAIGRLAAMGVTWTSAPLDQSSVAAARDGLARYGAEVLARIDR